MSYNEIDLSHNLKFSKYRKIKHAQKTIEHLCLKVSPDHIIYDFDAVVTPDNVFNLSYDDMNTLVFLLLFNNNKNNIYTEIFYEMFEAFFPNRKNIQSHRRLLDIFKFIKRQPLNMNKFLSILIKNKRSFYFNYIKNIMETAYDIITEEISKKYSLREYLLESTRPNITLDKLNLSIDNYEYLLFKLTNTLANKEYFVKTCNSFLDKFIREKIKFHSMIPIHIYYGIIKIYHMKTPERCIYNEGLLIEKHVIDAIKHKNVVKHNIDLGPHSSSLSGKKGEFDIVVGSLDTKNKSMILRSIYDIKRSARLIPDDIDKFNAAIDDDITLFEVDDTKNVSTIKMQNFTKGYIFVNDWDIRVETRYRLRDILIKIIQENADRCNFFTEFMDMIKYGTNGPYLQLSHKYKSLLSDLITKENIILQKKLSSFDIRKFDYSII